VRVCACVSVFVVCECVQVCVHVCADYMNRNMCTYATVCTNWLSCSARNMFSFESVTTHAASITPSAHEHLLSCGPLRLRHTQVDNPKFTDPHTKVNALLQTHFSRANITGGGLGRSALRLLLPAISGWSVLGAHQRVQTSAQLVLQIECSAPSTRTAQC